MNDTPHDDGAPREGKAVGPPPPAYQTGWGYQGYPPYPAYQYPKPSNAVTVLVLGIIGLAVFWPLGIVAWVMGNTELREIDGGLRPPDGRSMAQAGRICGIIGTCLFAAWCAFAILWFVLFFGMFGLASA